MNYKYSTINPITNKELYMYSSYHGIEFIKAYKQSRKQTIEKCLEKFKKIKGKKEITNRIYRFFIQQNHLEQEETIQLFLKLLKNNFNTFQKNSIKSDLDKIINDLDYLFKKAVDNGILDKTRIDNLVKKFEIKKSFPIVVKQAFSNNFFYNNIDETYHLIFSFIISKYFISTKSLKYLNTLLKLNDLLIYRFYNGNFSNTDVLACSIVLELKIFYELEEFMLEN